MTLPMLSLQSDTLPEAADRGLVVPSYDRTMLQPKIAHIGVGGFHRAHLAVYCHLLAAAGSDWGIRGIGLLPNDQAMASALGAQDFLYTLTIKSNEERTTEVIGSIIDFVYAAEDSTRAVTAIADPSIEIVSMTVTEAGYADEPMNHRTFDIIAAGLDARRTSRVGPVTILSCDNLPGNGDAAQGCVLAAAERHSEELRDWVATHCTFPNSMVDRITPQTADADRDYLRETFGVQDRWPVVAEPFWQWVLEDNFAASRPDFASVGALYTTDVHAWELYKLRMLNAGHSCLAYLAALADITFVDEALATPSIAKYLERFFYEEAIPVLEEIPGHPRTDYAASVIVRFANTGVRDQIARLCIDGTAKFPTFLTPTIAKQLAVGGPVDGAALALAGWAHYLSDVPLDDQAADALGHLSRPLAVAATTDPVAFLDANPALPDEVAAAQRFRDAFTAAYRSIGENGALAAIDEYLRSST